MLYLNHAKGTARKTPAPFKRETSYKGGEKMDIMEMVTKAILYGAIIGTVLAEVLKEINDYFKNHKQ